MALLITFVVGFGFGAGATFLWYNRDKFDFGKK